MTNSPGLDFLVNKSDWKRHRFNEAAMPDVGDGQVLFRVDRFAFTANNISYEAWSGFRKFSESWLEVRREYGREAVERVYEDTLAGRTEPQHGHVLSLWDAT